MSASAAKAAHTPGPWAIRMLRGKPFRSEGKWFVNGPTGLNPNVVGEKVGPPIADAYLSEDDARLIAAAPDLLTALIAVTDELERIATPESGIGKIRHVARAAIAKATGAA